MQATWATQTQSLLFVSTPFLLSHLRNTQLPYSPVCTPIFISSLWSSNSGMVNLAADIISSRQRSAISLEWLCPFLIGSPLTTMYTEPTVSTYKRSIWRITWSNINWTLFKIKGKFTRKLVYSWYASLLIGQPYISTHLYIHNYANTLNPQWFH